ncbi:hypothetical protein EVAR_6372_1 [Eumeta japonica]|uniref:Uncharacterized protein n=1 Tax=Eumeta variegata TaxID=151549 RepID=A0A4C1TCJ3_EUMVA|nr:hypothetical protein EVAR_6372_1 [Eumeta japonica]
MGGNDHLPSDGKPARLLLEYAIKKSLRTSRIVICQPIKSVTTYFALTQRERNEADAPTSLLAIPRALHVDLTRQGLTAPDGDNVRDRRLNVLNENSTFAPLDPDHSTNQAVYPSSLYLDTCPVHFQFLASEKEGSCPEYDSLIHMHVFALSMLTIRRLVAGRRSTARATPLGGSAAAAAAGRFTCSVPGNVKPYMRKLRVKEELQLNAQFASSIIIIIECDEVIVYYAMLIIRTQNPPVVPYRRTVTWPSRFFRGYITDHKNIDDSSAGPF